MHKYVRTPEESVEVTAEMARSPEFKSKLRQFNDILAKDKTAIALAAPQVLFPGEKTGWNVQVFGFKTRIQDGYGRNLFMNPSIFVNPLILDASDESSAEYEMCMSIPGKIYDVERPNVVTLKAQRILKSGKLGTKSERRLTGALSRVVQHEIDHLRGVMIDEKGDLVR